MQIYLVGGAVRDELLGLPVKERDWVVVGATPEALLTQGYRQVGKDFPVFLHPQSQEEYALARTERKTGAGYRGFEVHASPDVSLEQDLQRRDLTINAIAQDKDGHLIDPYGGQADIKRGLLRHISPAFSEDPVRILRVARFAARFAPLHFHVADETLSLMRTMCESGEVNALTAERVWAEFHKALRENSAYVFFEVLQSCAALNKIFPEVRRIESCNATLIQACKLSDEPQIRFAAWAYHLGEQGIQNLCKRLSTPHAYLDLALLVARQHTAFTHATELPPPRILEMLKELDSFRRPERFEAFLLAAEAVSRAIPGHEHWPHPQREYLHTTLVAARKITAKNLTKIGLEGDQIAVELDSHRRAAISKVKRTYRWAKFN